MARGTLASTLISMVKAEIGDNGTGNTFRDSELLVLLSNKQKMLCATYTFPFLEHRWDLTCAAGSRFLTIPTVTTANGDFTMTAGINFEHAVSVETKFNRVWLPCYSGVGGNEYTAWNSDIPMQIDPIRRWRMATNTAEAGGTNQSQVEVWPVPATSQTLRFTGQRQPLTLAATTDKADLDDMLLVLFVAAEKLLRLEQTEEAKYKLMMAQQHFNNIRAAYPTRDERLVLGDSTGFWREDRRLLPITILAQ